MAVEESETFLIKLSLLQYGIPLLGLVLGASLSAAYPVSLFSLPVDLTHLMGAFAGMLVGGIVSYFWATKIAEKKDTGFRIIHVEPR